MIAEKALIEEKSTFAERLRIVLAFVKMRLSFLVVVSSAIGYGIGATEFSAMSFVLLIISGFLVTGASNGFNQVIERDLDAKMARTENRPLPQSKLSVTGGLWLASSFAVSGLVILYFFINPLSAILAALALFSYVMLYTPLKRITPWAVFVGAFPGAIPPMLGYVAATGKFDLYAGLLFAVQFIWQFPHFWAIAWVLNDDYKKAGFRLLPSKGGRDSSSAFITLLYTLFLLPISILPWAFGMSGSWSAIVILMLGAAFAYPAFKLIKDKEVKTAKQLMFFSFFYLPLVQLLYLADKI